MPRIAIMASIFGSTPRLPASRTEPDGRVAITTNNGIVHADAVLVGAGAVPDTALAAAAGLGSRQWHCHRRSVPHLRPGDLRRRRRDALSRTAWPHPARRLAPCAGSRRGRRKECSRRQAKSTTRCRRSGRSSTIFICRASAGRGRSRASTSTARWASAASLVFQIEGTHLIYALGINAQRDIATARRLIERRIAVDPADLADPSKPLASLLPKR